MSRTFEERRDWFKQRARPIVQHWWGEWCNELGRTPTAKEREWWCVESIAAMNELLPQVLAETGWDGPNAERAKSDTNSVIRELVEELCTLEGMN